MICINEISIFRNDGGVQGKPYPVQRFAEFLIKSLTKVKQFKFAEPRKVYLSDLEEGHERPCAGVISILCFDFAPVINISGLRLHIKASLLRHSLKE